MQEFEDLDEITARYVQPMAAFARDLLSHKYFQDCNGGDRKVWIQVQIINKHSTNACINLLVII